MTVDDVLHYLHIDKSEYYNCLSVACGVDYEIHLKRPPNSCFINNYNPIVLFAWQANMDIQPVFNHHKCVTYLCSYMSKGETQCSEAKKDNLGLKDSLKKIGAAFLSSREVSSQECVTGVCLNYGKGRHSLGQYLLTLHYLSKGLEQ